MFSASEMNSSLEHLNSYIVEKSTAQYSNVATLKRALRPKEFKCQGRKIGQP